MAKTSARGAYSANKLLVGNPVGYSFDTDGGRDISAFRSLDSAGHEVTFEFSNEYTLSHVVFMTECTDEEWDVEVYDLDDNFVGTCASVACASGPHFDVQCGGLLGSKIKLQITQGTVTVLFAVAIMTAEPDLLEACQINANAVPYFTMRDTSDPMTVINQVPIPVSDPIPITLGSGLENVYTDYYVVDTNKEYTFTVSDFTDGDCV